MEIARIEKIHGYGNSSRTVEMDIRSLTNSMPGSILRSKKFILFFALLAVVLTSVAALSTQSSNATTKHGYLGLTLLDKNMNSAQYFVADSTVSTGEDVSWYLSTQNSMNTAEYIDLRIKLINSTQNSPDDKINAPSPEHEIYHLEQVVSPNTNWIAPLNWSIAEIETAGNYTVIKAVKINDNVINNLDVRSEYGNNFRFVIELWKYDPRNSEFTFLWTSDTEKSVWNQIWFNVKN